MNRKILTSIFLLLISSTLICQTVVRLSKPQQAEEPVAAWTLFDESLPAGIPSAIGAIGYEIIGGNLPYSYQWLENDRVIAEGELAIIVPSSENEYALSIKDGNNCNVIIPISVSSSVSHKKGSLEDDLPVYFKLTKDNLHIQGFLSNSFTVRLFDIDGRLMLEGVIQGETNIPVNLASGVYLLYIKSGDVHRVEKCIVY